MSDIGDPTYLLIQIMIKYDNLIGPMPYYTDEEKAYKRQFLVLKDDLMHYLDQLCAYSRQQYKYNLCSNCRQYRHDDNT